MYVFIYLFCVYVCVRAHTCTCEPSAIGAQKRASDLLLLELKMAVSILSWVLGTQPGCPRKVANTFN